MAVAHKGSISMGMVLIPVGLYKTTVDNAPIICKARFLGLKFMEVNKLGNYVNFD